MRYFLIAFFVIPLFAHLLTVQVMAGRGINVQVKTRQGKTVSLYNNSYALLIGVSTYTHGWPNLESVQDEVDDIEQVLRIKGFNITRIRNPDSSELKAAFDDFVNQYGFDEKNRLFFYFAGHGYSFDKGSKGYLVPSDAPDPNVDRKNFLRKSLNLTKLLGLSREMIANHALFLFDSCFSGTIFKTRSLPSMPPVVETSITKPVRQFITSGSAGEEVPAKSVFARLVVDGLNGEADLNNDGYILGSELGMFLASRVPVYAMQTPQYGKINEYDLSRGDFVFRADLNLIKRQLIDVPELENNNRLGEPVMKINRIEQRYALEIIPYKIGLNNNYLAIGDGRGFSRLYNLRTRIFEDDKLPYYTFSKLRTAWKNNSIRRKGDNETLIEIRENGTVKRHIKVSEEKYGKIKIFSFSGKGKILVGTSFGYVLIFNRQANLVREMKVDSSPVLDFAIFHNIFAVSLESRKIVVWHDLEKSNEIVEEFVLVAF